MGQLVVLALLYLPRTPGKVKSGFDYDTNALMKSFARLCSPGGSCEILWCEIMIALQYRAINR